MLIGWMGRIGVVVQRRASAITHVRVSDSLRQLLSDVADVMTLAEIHIRDERDAVIGAVRPNRRRLVVFTSTLIRAKRVAEEEHDLIRECDWVCQVRAHDAGSAEGS